jgi:hypothetical protein
MIFGRKPLLGSAGLISAALHILCLMTGCGPAPNPDGVLIDGSPRPDGAEGYFKVVADWDSSHYRNEVMARAAERVLAQLWDQINATTDDMTTALSLLGNASLTYPPLDSHMPSVNGVSSSASSSAEGRRDSMKPGDLLSTLQSAGWIVSRMQLRQTALEEEDAGRMTSRVEAEVHLEKRSGSDKAVWAGLVRVQWPEEGFAWDGADLKIVSHRLDHRTGGVPDFFSGATSFTVNPIREGFLIGPLIVTDLNSDHYPEIILPGANRVFWNQQGANFRPSRLLGIARPYMLTTLVADMDRDSRMEILTVDSGGLWVWQPGPQGDYLAPPQLLWKPESRIRGGMCMTAGDFNADGLTDLWVGQYKPPYEGGHMPQPFFDSNDGAPFFLLAQQSDGSFRDVTVEAGLSRWRNRRAFGGSFCDLDADGALDLIVISDFAGLDLYWNQGNGTFAIDHESMGSRRLALGMSHCLTDHNRNGFPEIVMTGMNSAAVDRLTHSSSSPDPHSSTAAMRQLVTVGNQWIEFRPDRSVTDFAPGGPWQRTGWTWGISRFDFNNDALDDYYITNGHETSPSVIDYESWFWCYDIFFGQSEASPAVDQYFDQAMAGTRGAGFSYGGYELNRLLVGPDPGDNGPNPQLIEIGHFAGLASQLDCRAAVSADLDLDGHIDIVHTTFEFWPTLQQRLFIHKNNSGYTNSWVGFHADPGLIQPGARFRLLETADRSGSPHRQQNKWLVFGESYRSQHPWTVHFGLGQTDPQHEFHLEILNPDGKSWAGKVQPGVYHRVPDSLVPISPGR